MTRKEVETLMTWSTGEFYPNPFLGTGICRFQTFLAIKPLLKGKLYWKTLGDAYTGSDNLFYYSEDMKRVFESSEPCKEFLMNIKEKAFFDELPILVTIYRAMTEAELKSKNYGVSWTLDINVAKFFLEKYKRNFSTNHLRKVVHCLKVKKEKVVAYFQNREEHEVIYIHMDMEKRRMNYGKDCKGISR